MNRQEFTRTIASGGKVFGTLISSPSPIWPVEVRKTGVDFVFIDTEHMPIGRETLSWMCQTYRAAELNPVVRIPSHDPYQACMALDGGACGIVAPYIETPEQVRKLVALVKYRPLKGERAKACAAESGVASVAMDNYVRQYNKDILLIANIESLPAIQALDGILSVPGLDGILIGPHDLSCSLDVPEQYDHPVFLHAVSDIIQKAKEYKKCVGIHFFWGVDQEIKWLHEGMNMVIHSSDMVLFTQKLHSDILAMKRAWLQGSVLRDSGEAPPPKFSYV